MQHDQRGVEKHPWTAERVEMLKQMWNEGLSASTIAGRLGPGVTRNAVIGKVHRLGLSGRPTPARSTPPRPRAPRQPGLPMLRLATSSHEPKPQRTRGGKPGIKRIAALAGPPPERPPAAALAAYEAERRAAGAATLETVTPRQCHWPVGPVDGAQTPYCGAPAVSLGRPYCEAHMRVRSGRPMLAEAAE